MPENSPPGSLPGLQTLGEKSQKAFHSDKHSESNGYGCIGLHPTKPEAAPASTGRPDSIRTGSGSYQYCYRNATPISTQSTRSILRLPDTDTDTDTYTPDNTKYLASNSRTRLLPSQPTRFASRSSRVSVSSEWSRLPTPSYQPPPGSGYSHEMYRREGRRRVFSSLGKKYTSLGRNLDRAGMTNKNKRVISDSALKTSSVQMQSPWKSSSAGSRVVSSNNTSKVSARGPNTMILRPKSSNSIGAGSMLSLLSSRSNTVAIETTTELEHGASQSSDESNGSTTGPFPFRKARKRPSLRKVRIKRRPTLPLPQRHDDDLEYCTPHRELPSTFARLRDEMAPKKIWAHGLQSFRSKEKSSWRPGEQGHGLANSRSDLNANSSQIPIPLPSPELRVCRGRDRTERMVSEAKPKHYWLGRFVTLTNAFHYEDSFSEPDTATGFGMLSSYSFRLTDGADKPGYRVKRAFMVLENVCVTKEANLSLQRFRDEYILKYGARWIGY